MVAFNVKLLSPKITINVLKIGFISLIKMCDIDVAQQIKHGFLRGN